MSAQQIGPTERLYFDDQYARSFNAQVVSSREADGRHFVALDRSAFYPEGGGQPGDRGTLNGIAVHDTQVVDEVVWHEVAAPIDEGAVQGEIDWAWRFDFMQQHHGQHLLSAGFEQTLDTPTVGVHLGSDTCTVDIARTRVTASELADVEAWTNDVIYRDLPVAARFVTATELAMLKLRKPPPVVDRIRIVSAGDVDHSPCGGTHPHRTGEVGIVAIQRSERRGDATRVEFLCGRRALDDYRGKTALLNRVTADLSIAPTDLPATIDRIRAAEEANRKALQTARRELVGFEARSLLADAPRYGNVPVVAQIFAGRELDEIRLLGRLIAEGAGIALLGVRAEKAQFVFQRTLGIDVDMGALLRTATAMVGGKGGGRPEAAQGGGPDVANAERALEAARVEVQRMLT